MIAANVSLNQAETTPVETAARPPDERRHTYEQAELVLLGLAQTSGALGSESSIAASLRPVNSRCRRFPASDAA